MKHRPGTGEQDQKATQINVGVVWEPSVHCGIFWLPRNLYPNFVARIQKIGISLRERLKRKARRNEDLK